MTQPSIKSEPSTEARFSISLFDSKTDNQPKAVARTWSELGERFAKPAVRASKDGTLFSGASFNDKRAKENVTEISLLTLDYDHDAAWERDLACWQAQGCAFGAYTTHSHQRVTDDHPHAEDRFRVVIPLAVPIGRDLFPALWQWAFQFSGEKIDKACRDESRMVYTPAKAHSGAPYAYHIEAGAFLDWRKLDLTEKPKQAEKQAPQEKLRRLEKYVEVALEEEAAKVASAGNGSRNATLNQAAFALGTLVGAGVLPEWSAVSKLTDAARFVKPPDAEIQATLNSGLAAGKQQPRELPAPSNTMPQRPIAEAGAVSAEPQSRELIQWPDPLEEAAFHGLAGDLVRAIEPHTEADPVALLVQFLTAYGNVIGRNSYFVAEADHHYLNLFIVLVGNTSKGRKGTSWGQTKNLFGSVDDHWQAHCVKSGLSSGEGLIWAVRNAIEKAEPIREKKAITGYQKVVVDEGIADKRILAIESEFASVLKVASREGNTVSAILRQAWDDGNLNTLTKNSPAKATDAHISIIGHITRDELRRYLEATESANGFANRFLWLCVRRSKSLPEGGSLNNVDFGELQRRLNASVIFARKAVELRRDSEARALWFDVYANLSEGKAGLLGAVTSRAEAQVMRLACIYALLDCSAEIKLVHLEAALSLWRYAESSARYIFGDAMGDPVADTILISLREAGDAGLTRTEISNLLGRNHSSSALTRALTSLAENGRARFQKEPKEDTKKPVERWFAILTPTTNLTKFTNLFTVQATQDRTNSLNSLNSSSVQNIAPLSAAEREVIEI